MRTCVPWEAVGSLFQPVSWLIIINAMSTVSVIIMTKQNLIKQDKKSEHSMFLTRLIVLDEDLLNELKLK